ncbi:MAG: hypothetical protein WC525_06250 [Candidatus Thermoplasmatota archaeon]
MVEVIEPPSLMQEATTMLTVLLCFILILLAVWFATSHSYVPAFFSMAGAGFIIWVIGAIKGAFRR